MDLRGSNASPEPRAAEPDKCIMNRALVSSESLGDLHLWRFGYNQGLVTG